MKGKFDISWKGILALFIVLTFLLSAVDLVVHGEEIDNDAKLFIERWDKFQEIENRRHQILKEEDEDASYIIVWGISRTYDDDESTTYKYSKYDSNGTRIGQGYITLPNGFVDSAYLVLYLDDDTWLDYVSYLADIYGL